MAHPYTTQARVELFLGAARVAAIGDRDESGALDTGLVADAIERVCNRIDGAVGNRYAVPFVAVTATPGQVQDLADIGVAMLLYDWLSPSSADAKSFRIQFEGDDGSKGLLGRYRTGAEIIVGATDVDANTGARSVGFESTGTTVAGAIDSAGERTTAWSQDDAISTEQANGI